jgi:UDP-glucose 4-epimerase
MLSGRLTGAAGEGPWSPVVLRYFNAAGADPERRIGEWHSPETHAVPLAIEVALGRRPLFRVFGSDYDTRDGTCVRDFVHVMDLADAHTRGVKHLLDGGESMSLNLGTGRGTTIKELISAIEDVSGRKLPLEYVSRRAGDSPELVADNAKAKQFLGWSPQYDLRFTIQTAWDWHSQTNVL